MMFSFSERSLGEQLDLEVKTYALLSYESPQKPTPISKGELAAKIDHTLLKPEATLEQFKTLFNEALQHHFYAVCVPSSWVKHAKAHLKSETIKIATVVGFPHGNASTRAKTFETAQAIRHGADEIDMVIHLGFLKSGDYLKVAHDIWEVVQAAQNKPVKVILETSVLTLDEKIKAAAIAKLAGATFLKTSTGFASGGATTKDVALLRAIAGDTLKVKASGGIRSYDDALAMILAGADRLGTSSGVNMMLDQKGDRHEVQSQTDY